jgi:hypothetical protein
MRAADTMRPLVEKDRCPAVMEIAPGKAMLCVLPKDHEGIHRADGWQYVTDEQFPGLARRRGET